MSAALTPERIAELREWAQRGGYGGPNGDETLALLDAAALAALNWPTPAGIERARMLVESLSEDLDRGERGGRVGGQSTNDGGGTYGPVQPSVRGALRRWLRDIGESLAVAALAATPPSAGVVEWHPYGINGAGRDAIVSGLHVVVVPAEGGGFSWAAFDGSGFLPPRFEGHAPDLDAAKAAAVAAARAR